MPRRPTAAWPSSFLVPSSCSGTHGWHGLAGITARYVVVVASIGLLGPKTDASKLEETSH